MNAPQVILRDPGGFVGVWREVHFEKWSRRGTAAQIRARFEAQKQWIATLPAQRQIVTIAVVDGAAVAPLDRETRAAIDEGVAAMRPRVKASAVVLHADGFKAVVIRSILAAFTLVGSRTQMKTFDDLGAALAWVGPVLDDDGGRAPTVDEAAAAWRALVDSAATATA